MAYTQNQWEVVKAYFEQGLSLSEIVERPEVAITDRSSISKRAKSEGWIKGKNQPLQQREVQARQALADAAEEKSTFNSTEIAVHETLVAEQVRYMSHLRRMAIKNAEAAMNAPCDTQSDFLARSRTVENAAKVIDPARGLLMAQPASSAPLNEVSIEQYLIAREQSLKTYLSDDAD